MVLATTTQQMFALFDSLIIKSNFPQEAIDYLSVEYVYHPKAKMFMECYVYGCGNLHQTTTSRNEGSHAAFRSKSSNIPNPVNSYLQRRVHKKEWMQRLRAQARHARNRIPLDIQAIPELKNIAGKVSIFALTEIRRQLMLAKKENPGRPVSPFYQCSCHGYARYGLPCRHMVPLDGSPMQLDYIAPMWRLDNWDQGKSWSISFTSRVAS